MYQRFGLFVAGEWRQAKSGAKAALISPVTGDSLGEAPVASVADKEEELHVAEAGRFRTDGEAIERANACDMGLAAYAFTRLPTRARRTIAGLKAGMVGINSFALAASEAPFGGTNFSGMGREGGVEGIHDYLDVKLAQVVF